jgi:hypothetical protein
VQRTLQLLHVRRAEPGEELPFDLIGEPRPRLHDAAALGRECDAVLAPVTGMRLASDQPRGPVVSPVYLADLLWTMHNVSRPPEALYPENVFTR